MRRVGVLSTLAACALLALQGVAHAAVPQVQAHRGGSVLNGVPTFPENTMPAFQFAAANGWTIELDVTRTKDGMVVLHDPTLDRTTVCTGPARTRTTAQIVNNCPSDVLGSPGSSAGGHQVPGLRVPVPRLQDVLALARATGARLSIEIKNVPTESDFDPLGTLALKVVNAVKSSGLPPSQVTIQSFWPPSLDVSESLAHRYPTSLLTLNALNAGGPLLASVRRYEWFSPGWPIDAASVSLAHLLGVKVVPYTLNKPADVRAARNRGVDAIITDDPPMALAALSG